MKPPAASGFDELHPPVCCCLSSFCFGCQLLLCSLLPFHLITLLRILGKTLSSLPDMSNICSRMCAHHSVTCSTTWQWRDEPNSNYISHLGCILTFTFYLYDFFFFTEGVYQSTNTLFTSVGCSSL